MTDVVGLASRLASHLDPSRHAEVAEVDALLDELIDAARDAWPKITLDTDELLAYLAARLPEETPVAQALGQLSHRELYLACACVRGAPEAIRAFERRYLALLPAAVIRAGFSPALAEEVLQLMRERLLVGTKDTPPRLAQYGGRGSLHNWLRVAAVREALRLQIRRGREVASPAERLDSLAEHEEDPELRYLKQAYRDEFDAAFVGALGTLTVRERSLLRYHFLDGLTLESLARRYRVHRTTVARQIARARRRLLLETRLGLQQRLGARHSEVESLVRLLQSQLGITLRGSLGGAVPPSLPDPEDPADEDTPS